MIHNIIPWLVFFSIIFFMLFIDLGVFQKKSHKISIKESLIWTLVWIIISLLFNAGIYFFLGPEPALNFLTGYLLEKSLSVDNIFVFILIFSYFKVKEEHQHRILIWGVLGAIVMRAIFISAGIVLLHAFHFVIYIFGVILIITAIKMLVEKDKEIHPEKNPILNLFKRFFPVTHSDGGGKFFIRQNGKLLATSLLIVLITIETTDLLFAVDSIPAILAITTDPFIVFTSNIFAILGLRSLYYALAGIMNMFKYLNYGLSAVLAFIGIKMLMTDFYKIPIGIVLAVIATILLLSIIMSLVIKDKEETSQT